MNTWNYRIIRKIDNDGTYFFEIHECHYQNGELTTWDETPAAAYGEDPDELQADLQMMLEAFPRGVLNEEDLPE